MGLLGSDKKQELIRSQPAPPPPPPWLRPVVALTAQPREGDLHARLNSDKISR